MKWSIVLGVFLLCFLGNNLSGKQCILLILLLLSLGTLDIYLKTIFQDFQNMKITVLYGILDCRKSAGIHKLYFSLSNVVPYEQPPAVPYWSYSTSDWVLSTDYNSTALVYSCTDVLRFFHVDFAWILSRSRILPAEAIYHAKENLSRNNIDVSKMFPTDQQGCDSAL
uniref:Apolipoprotein D n=1 Tax=Sinocyclocheilus grahami TaxID=75366 RepID=A0A672K0B1_SINGR